MTIDTAELRRLAGEATAGPWGIEPPSKSRAALGSFSSLNLWVDSLGQGASSACETGTMGPAWM